MTRFKFTILVACKNEINDIGALFYSLRDLNHSDYEVLFVDDSTDGTREFLDTACFDLPNFNVIEGDNSGCCQARNKALGISRGSVIVFSTADTIFDKDYLDYLEAIFYPLDKNVAVFVPNSVIVNTENDWAVFLNELHKRDFYSCPQFTGQGYAVLAELAIKVGGISGGDYPFNFCRDWSLANKIKSQYPDYDYLVSYNKTVCHVAPHSFAQFLKERVLRGQMSTFHKKFYLGWPNLKIFSAIVFKFFYFFIRVGFIPLEAYIFYNNSSKELGRVILMRFLFINKTLFIWGELLSFADILLGKRQLPRKSRI